VYTCNVFLLDVLIQLSFREAGQGRAGQGRAGQVRAGQGRAGQGRAGQGRAGQGRAGQGRAGQGSLDDCLETFLALVAGASHQGAWPGVPMQLVHGFNQSNTHRASSPLQMIKTQ